MAGVEQPAGDIMADHAIPHLTNDAGVSAIRIGAREFMCIGAKPPFDHPHVYLDMGAESEILCPYCSTLYRFDKALHAGESDPPGCVFREREAA
jgi:uncharacterized Zn-finger protein